MLSCKQITEQACDYLEKHLTFRQRLQVWLHLLICHHCRRYIRQIRSTVGCLHSHRKSVSDQQAEEIVVKIINHKNCPHD